MLLLEVLHKQDLMLRNFLWSWKKPSSHWMSFFKIWIYRNKNKFYAAQKQWTQQTIMKRMHLMQFIRNDKGRSLPLSWMLLFHCLLQLILDEILISRQDFKRSDWDQKLMILHQTTMMMILIKWAHLQGQDKQNKIRPPYQKAPFSIPLIRLKSRN